jgi:hypothetical protein
VVSGVYALNTNSSAPAENLLRLESGLPLLAAYGMKNGEAFVFTVPLNVQASNLPTHPVFAPVVYRMALLGARPLAKSATVGEFSSISLMNVRKGEGDVFRLIGRSGQNELIPRVQVIGSRLTIDPGDELKAAGIYDLFSGSDTVSVLAYNYNRDESFLDYFTEEELNELIISRNLSSWNVMSSETPDLGKSVVQSSKGTPLWKIALLLSLLFLLTEILLIRYWKTT